MTGTEDIIGSSIVDSRDVIERIAFLEDADNRNSLIESTNLFEDELLEELRQLQAFAQEVKDRGLTSEWESGVAFIHEDYWDDHVREFVADVEGLDTDSFVYSYVKWDELAASMKMDYSDVLLAGHTYWARG